MRTSAPIPILCAAALAALSCAGGGAAETPRPSSVEPATGSAATPTRVVIRGDGFLARPSERQSGGGAALDTRHRAWLGDAELEAVTWVDVHTLEATVPAGLAPGPRQLVVENALGRRGALDGAFEVIATAAAALEASLGAAPAEVNVGQPLTATLTVRNGGGTAATTVTPDALSLDGTAASGAAVTGPSPASIARLEPGGIATFTWSVTPAVPGVLTLSTRARGVDAGSSAEVTSAAAAASAQAQLPAALTATIAASRSTANVGQAFDVTLTLANGGAARADLTTVTPGTAGPAATCGAVSPALPQSVATGAVLQLTWTCSASAPGSLALLATVAGVDGTSGAPLSATPATPAQVAVQTPAALGAAVAVQGSPTTVLVGQALSVTLTVSDSGQADASVTSATPVVDPPGAAFCGAVTPAPPAPVAGLGARSFTWSCTALTAGSLSLGATATGTDANTGAALQATAPPVTLSVLLPAALTATVAANRSTADVGQAITVTFTLTNGGTATANVTTVTPSHAGTAAATCGTPSPAPTPIAAGGSSTFTWTCSASTAGSLTLSGTATGTDAVSGAPLSASPASPASVIVQVPAALTATIVADRTTAVVGQAVALTLTVANTGGAGATVSSVVPTTSGTAAATCGAVTPVPPVPVAGLGTRSFTWSCTALTAGSLSLGATVTGTDSNTGAALQATAPPVTLSVLLPAALTATVAANRSTADVGQAITVTFTLTNGGTATANVTTVTPSHAGTAAATCGTPSPAPTPIAAGGSSTFTWTCTPSAAGTLVLSGTAAGTDAVSGAPLSASPASPASVIVQVPAALTATIVADRTTAVVGQAVALTLTVANTGGAGATVSSVVPTTSGTAAATCGAVTPAPPVSVTGGTAATFAWTCTPSSAGTLVASASVGGADVNSGAPLQASADPGATITVTPAGALTATSFTASPSTLDVGQPTTVTLVLSNGGATAADVTAIAPTMAPAATPGCGPPNEALPVALPTGGTATFTWTCSASTPGAYSLEATVTSTPPLATGPAPIPVTVQTPALLAPAALAASRATADVGQPFTVSVVLTNQGQATASVGTATLGASGTGTAACGPASPALPQALAGGASLTLSWTCTGSTAGTVTFSAAITAADVNTGADVSPAVSPVDVAVQTPAALTATLTPAPSGPVAVNTTVTLTLSLQNTGQATARVGAVTPSKTGGNNVSCDTTVTPAPPQDVAGGSTATFTWNCKPTKPNTYTLGASVGAIDLNTGAALTVAVPTVAVTAN